MNLDFVRSLLLAVPLALAMWLSPVLADPIGILPTEPGSLPTTFPSGHGGPISSPTLVPITINGQGVLSSNPNDVWEKQVVWEYTTINTGDVLCIDESIDIFNPLSTSAPFALTDWEEELLSTDSRFVWHPTSSLKVNGIDAGAGQINGSEIRFDYEPIVPGIPGGTPVTLDIRKYITYTGDGPITGGGGASSISFTIRERPSVPEPSGLHLLAFGMSCWIARRRKP